MGFEEIHPTSELAEADITQIPQFSITLPKFAAIIKYDRLGNNLDASIAISGWKGYGKSTLGYKLAEGIDTRFKLSRNFLFDTTFEAIEKKFYGLERDSVLIIDEAIKSFYKLEWYSDLQKNLVKLLSAEQRKERKVVILCLPYFSELSSSFRNKIVDYWIHIPLRGLALVFQKSANPASSDPWNLKVNNKIWDEETRNKKTIEVLGDIDLQLRIFTKFKGFITAFGFDQMPQEEEEEYVRLYSEARKAAKLNPKESSRLRTYRELLCKSVHLLNTEHNVPQPKIAEKLGMPYRTLAMMMSEYKSHLNAYIPPAPHSL